MTIFKTAVVTAKEAPEGKVPVLFCGRVTKSGLKEGTANIGGKAYKKASGSLNIWGQTSNIEYLSKILDKKCPEFKEKNAYANVTFWGEGTIKKVKTLADKNLRLVGIGIADIHEGEKTPSLNISCSGVLEYEDEEKSKDIWDICRPILGHGVPVLVSAQVRKYAEFTSQNGVNYARCSSVVDDVSAAIKKVSGVEDEPYSNKAGFYVDTTDFSYHNGIGKQREYVGAGIASAYNGKLTFAIKELLRAKDGTWGAPSPQSAGQNGADDSAPDDHPDDDQIIA